MRLLDLDLENWGPHERLRVDFSAGLQIEGRNGVGKSSILEAVRFVFSKRSDGYRSKVRRSCQYARVKLRFSVDGDVYSVERRVSVDKASSAVLWINRERVADTVSSVYGRLEAVFPGNLFDRLVYVPQGCLTDIVSELRVQGGRKAFDFFFGLDRFEDVYKGVSGDLKVKEGEEKALGDRLKMYPADGLRFYDVELKRLRDLKEVSEKKYEEVVKECNVLDSKINQLEERLSSMRDVKKRIDLLRDRINEVRLRRKDLEAEVRPLKDKLRELDVKRGRLEVLNSSAEGLRRFNVIRDILYNLRDCEQRLSLLTGLDEEQRVYDRICLELNSLPNLEVECESLEKKLQKLKVDVEVRRKEVKELKTYLSELSSLSGKPRCPRCGQPLTEEHVSSEKNAAEDRIAVLNKEIKDLSAEILFTEDGLKKVCSELDELKRKGDANKERRERIKKGFEEREVVLKNVERFRKELADAGYCDESIDFVEERVQEFSKLMGQIDELCDELSKEEQYRKDIESKEKDLLKLSSDEEAMSEELKKLDYDDSLFNDLQKRKEDFQKKRSALDVELERIKSDISKIDDDIDDLCDRRQEFVSLLQKLEEVRREFSLLNEAKDIFHIDRGVVKYLREKYIKQLSVLLTQNFRRINQNPKYVDVVFTRDYDIEVRSKSGVFYLDDLSGGERTQLAVALRLSLLELLSPVRLLILDEPFGSLDREHRESLGRALSNLAVDGQLIIVTHIPVESLQLPKLELSGY